MIAARSSTRIKLLPGVAELDVGQVEGLTVVQLQQQFPDVLRAWRGNPAIAVMPDGESLTYVQKRAGISVKDITKRHGDENVSLLRITFPYKRYCVNSSIFHWKNFHDCVLI